MSTAPRPQTLAIAAHKGGVGKTTTAMALAAALARGGYGEVLLVDFDPQGHSTLGLGVDVVDDDLQQLTVGELLDDRHPATLADVTHRTGIPGLSIVPATIRLELTAQTMYAQTMRHVMLRDALESGGDRYAWTVLDCPPSLGPLTENALVAADRVIVPCRMEARATNGLDDLVRKLTRLRGLEFTAWRILRTVVDSHNRVANTAIDGALREKYAGWLLDTVIPKSEALNRAQIARLDIFTVDPRSAGAEAYVALVEEIRKWDARNTASST